MAGCSIALIPSMGAWGAAIASVASNTAMLLVLGWFARREGGVPGAPQA
jgi:O-antigen/teichoic acid export membrane protein